MSSARHPSPSSAAATAATGNPTDPGVPAATVTGFDGTVLVRISRHLEYPEASPGSTGAPLTVVDVAGDLDVDTAPLLRTVLAGAVRANRRVCCDLGRVNFLGAAAVNTLFATLAEADEAGCAFTVRGVHGSAVRVFRITGLDVGLASRQ